MKVKNKLTGLEFNLAGKIALQYIKHPDFEILEISEEEKELLKPAPKPKTDEELFLEEDNYDIEDEEEEE